VPGPITITPLAELPEVTHGADLVAFVVTANGGADFSGEDVIVLSHKVVSKAEGQIVNPADVQPGDHALTLAEQLDRDDPELIEVILGETRELIRAERGVLICRTRHGFVCANAGVDRSNAGATDRCILLPVDPDESARRLRAALPGRPAVVIADSFGRAWRNGECDVAIGAAGLTVLDDRRGSLDRDGRVLSVSSIAIADQAAAAADLARGGKAAGRPAVLISGLEQHITSSDGPGAAALLRDRSSDLFGAVNRG
jgi:coenzyme F420-0:L-glutamate ligase/coenzyme F420-1:gamma-L-glutamate ligase